MTMRQSLSVPVVGEILPHNLGAIGQRLPVTSGDFVPLSVYDIPFELETPNFAPSETGGVMMSLGRPFGFIAIDNSISPAKYLPDALVLAQTQKFDGVELAVDPEQEGLWTVRPATDSVLGPVDERLIIRGIAYYVKCATEKRHRQQNPVRYVI